ncbi:unnamed protein product, partial [Iphiclides podalirius]
MILKVKEFCEAEQKNQGVLIPLNNVRKRVAAITGVSVKTVTRITKEGIIATSTSKKIVTPGKSRPHPKKFDLDGFDGLIRQEYDEIEESPKWEGIPGSLILINALEDSSTISMAHEATCRLIKQYLRSSSSQMNCYFVKNMVVKE